MAHIPHLGDLAIIAGIGVLVSIVLARLRLPTVTGLLLAGAIAGPHGLSLVSSSEAITALAELGVVLLLFSIGLELSIERMRTIFGRVALGGVAQVVLTILVATGIALGIGREVGPAVLFGFVFALSSTAIVLRALSERRELDAPHGRFIVAALLFQDLCVVPMVLIVPILGSGATALEASTAIAWALAKAVALVAAMYLISRWLVPRAMAWVDASRSREVFQLAVLGICIGTAWLSAVAGLSLALGAFLGGMVVADTGFGHRALSDVLPVRDIFVSIFFVSLGMLFDGGTVIASPLAVGLLVIGFLFGKGLLATLAAMAMHFPPRAAWLAGVGLAQFGEFGFVIATLGVEAGVITVGELQVLLSAGILSMFATPVLVRIAPHLSAGERLLAPLAKVMGVCSIGEPDETETLSGHVVVVGYGVAGRLVARSLERSGIRYLVIELNAQAVRDARAHGKPVYYGDATSSDSLENASLARASALVLVANDPSATARVVRVARKISADLPILVRAHYVQDRVALEELGADEVVLEEVESGIEIVARVLRLLEQPRNVIDEQVRDARSTLPVSARRTTLPRHKAGDVSALASMKIDTVLVRGGSRAVGRTLVELELRRRTGALAFAIRRGGSLCEPPEMEGPLCRDDVVFVVGTSEAVAEAATYLDARDRDRGAAPDPTPP
ncbi:MAG: cation:proton antiporter [Myxococcota bacterium]|nr:cation:proton antiporter [Myxococcota bacterium]